MSYRRTRTVSGFTLLELLIVITIIAVLAVVLILVLDPAEILKKSRDTQRMSDFSTLKTALGVYVITTSTPALANPQTQCKTGSGAGSYTASSSIFYSKASEDGALSGSLDRSGASSTLSVVQAKSNFKQTNTSNLSVTIATTAGDFLLIHISTGQYTGETVTVTDSASQTWIGPIGELNDTVTGVYNSAFYIPNSAAVTSVTANFSGVGATYTSLIVLEFSGVATNSPLDGSAVTNSSGAPTSPTSTSAALTTSNANDVLFFATGPDRNTTSTAGSGYTIPANATTVRGAVQYKIVSSTQSGVITTTGLSPNADWDNVLAAFKALGVASPSQALRASSTLTDGTGWIPVNFDQLTGGSPISNEPLDPTNSTASSTPTSADLVYRYVCNASTIKWEAATVLESNAYTVADDKRKKDGGNNPNYYEVGTNLNLLGTGTDF